MIAHDYHCPDCNHTWELFGSLAEHRSVLASPCPECGASHVHRAFMKPPMIKTAATWLKGQGTLLDHFGDTPEGRRQLAQRIAVANSEGIYPTSNWIYDETVAAYPGQGVAFIPPDDPAGHVRRVCQHRGVGCDSRLLKVKGAEPMPIAPAPLADDLVRDLAAEKIRANPDLGQKTKTEMAEMVRDKHSYPSD